jgi:Zn-dependent protease with chaperone function
MTATPPVHSATAEPGLQRPAALAADRLFAVTVALGIIGLGSAVFVATRLLESWRVKPGATSHHVSVFGQRLSYPVANGGAIVVAVLAAVGLVMAGAALFALGKELLADRRFTRAMAARSPVALDGAWVIEDDRPQAFCAGLLHPRVYLSTGTLELLEAPALAAVLAHERHHARCHDPLRRASGRVLAAGLFCLPAVARMVSRQHSLSELSADEAAVLTPGVERSALASAMLGFSEEAGAHGAGIDPERVDHLLGETTQWRLPLALCLAVGIALAVFVTLAVLAASVAAGTATLAPPFLSSQPCILVLAMIPATFSLAAVSYARLHQARERTADRPAVGRR